MEGQPFSEKSLGWRRAVAKKSTPDGIITVFGVMLYTKTKKHIGV